MDQAAGAKCPHNNYEEDMIQSIHNMSILAATKLVIMQHAVPKSPKVSISAHGIWISYLLDSGSEVMLLRESYFEQHLLSEIKSVTSKKAITHKLFNLTAANDGWLPIKMYAELDITFLGLKGSNFDVLIFKDPYQVLDKKHQSKLPGIIGWI